MSLCNSTWYYRRYGIGLGIVFYLRQLSPQYFGGMPAFSISYPSIIAGIVVGLLTVLLAARSPAKKHPKFLLW